MEARDQIKLLLDLQGHAIQAALPPGRGDNWRRRKRVSRRLERNCVAIARHLKPEIVVEIGAHEGTFSRHMRTALPESRVIAFEANDKVFDKYRPIMTAAGVDYLNLCIAEAPGRRTFTVPITPTGRERHKMGSLLTHSRTLDSRAFEVEAVRLDGFLGEDAGRRNVIWLDVEGAVGDVLKGAGAALGACVGLFAELETVRRWDGQMIDVEVFAALADHGLFPVLRDFQKPGQYNALFLRGEGARDPVIAALARKFVRLSSVKPAAAAPAA